MRPRALLVLVAVGTSSARADEPDRLIPAAPVQTRPSTLAEKLAVMSGEWITSGLTPELMLRQQGSIYPNAVVSSTGRSAFSADGYDRGVFPTFGPTETAGRWVIGRGGFNSATPWGGADSPFHTGRGRSVVFATPLTGRLMPLMKLYTGLRF